MEETAVFIGVLRVLFDVNHEIESEVRICGSCAVGGGCGAGFCLRELHGIIMRRPESLSAIGK
jgi:hypothetical protein